MVFLSGACPDPCPLPFWTAPQELELAQLLVESLAARFEPAKYKDSYRENLRALIDGKIRAFILAATIKQKFRAPSQDSMFWEVAASAGRARWPDRTATDIPS